MKMLNTNEIIEHLKDINETDKMIKYYVDTYYFYQLDDGLILEFRKKPSIDKTVWYDDETEAPKLTEEYFIRYNDNHLTEYATIEYDERLKPYFMQRSCTDKKSTCLATHYALTDYEQNLRWAKDKDYFQRYATKEEIEEYNKICNELKQQYIERLKKYFKRYEKNIRVSGYWANR